LDIESFFESISERQVFHVFREIGYPGKLAFELARVCTRVSGGEYKYSRPKWSAKGRETVRGERVIFRLGHLPQGAPTSPTLANLVCRKMDTQLSEIAGRYHCNYTRYADDITFSGLDLDEGTAKVLLVHAIDIVKKAGFRPNSKKTRIIRPGVRKIVTGLIVNGKAPTLSKSFKDRVRAHLYFVKTKGAAEHCENQGFSSILSFKEHLWGLIIYAGSIDGRFGEKCKSKYAEIEWF
jgi:RNA-directed DNA polymerase